MSARLDLRIDALILEGFDRVDGQRLGRALERDLARLLEERGVPEALTRGRDVREVVTSPVELASSATPGAVAAALARAIYDGLRR